MLHFSNPVKLTAANPSASTSNHSSTKSSLLDVFFDSRSVISISPAFNVPLLQSALCLHHRTQKYSVKPSRFDHIKTYKPSLSNPTEQQKVNKIVVSNDETVCVETLLQECKVYSENAKWRYIESGHFGKVYHLVDGETEYAIKLIKPDKIDKNYSDITKGEILGLKIKNHPNIIKTEGILLLEDDDRSYQYITKYEDVVMQGLKGGRVVATVMELAKGADLITALKKNIVQNGIELAIDIGIQVCEALIYLHNNKIIYRDIKTREYYRCFKR